MLVYKAKKTLVKHAYFWFFSSIIFIYILLRAIYIPLAHDEAASFFHYVLVGDFIPYKSLFEANNHLLNSFLEYLSFRLFGNSEIALRLPNVLSFWIYAYFACRISFALKEKWIRSILLIALLTSTSLVEFFSLARGYGLSMAFFMAMIYYAGIFLSGLRVSDQLKLWLFGLLAILSNLALLNSFLLLILLVFLAVFIRGGNVRSKLFNLLPLVLFAVPFFIMASIYAFDLKEHGALYLGSLAGFTELTVYSLLRMEFGIQNYSLAYILGLLILFFNAALLWLKRENYEELFSHSGLVVFLLLGNVVGAMLLAGFFEVNYPEDRAAMYFIPLSILSVALLSDCLSTKRKLAAGLVILLLIFPLNLLFNLTISSLSIWKGETIEDEMFLTLLDSPKNPQGPTSVGGYSIFQANFAYQNLNHGSDYSWMSTTAYPNFTVDYNIARPKELDSLSSKYELIYHQDYNGLSLLKRKTFMERQLLLDTHVHAFAEEYSGEYFDLFRVKPDLLAGKNILFQIGLTFDSYQKALQCNLVISATDKAGNKYFYEWMPLHWIYPKWDNQTFTMVRSIPNFPEDAEELVIYIWNTGEVKFSGGAESIQIFELRE